VERPEWLTKEKFGKRVVLVFKYYNNKDLIKRTNDSLDALFGEDWDGGGGGNGIRNLSRVAPE